MKERILRSYRHLGPSRFYALNQGIRKAIATDKLPASVWVSNPELPILYLGASEKHDEVFHEAKHGSDLMIMQRDALQQQICEYLDEMAPLLEAAAVRNPQLLLLSGFDLAKERRNAPRSKATHSAPDASAAEHEGSNQ